jgi:hypothetical protein
MYSIPDYSHYLYFSIQGKRKYYISNIFNFNYGIIDYL